MVGLAQRKGRDAKDEKDKKDLKDSSSFTVVKPLALWTACLVVAHRRIMEIIIESPLDCDPAILRVMFAPAAVDNSNVERVLRAR
jgi:hypothetical protein